MAEDLGHHAALLGLDRHLHLHRLDDHERVTLLHRLADLAGDAPDGAGDLGLHDGHGNLRMSGRADLTGASLPAVLVTARDEADGWGPPSTRLPTPSPARHVVVADDGSTDATAAVARAHGATVVATGRRTGKGGAATLGAGALTPSALVVLCDADLGASARELPALLGPLERGEADLVVGGFARRVGGGVGLVLRTAGRAIEREGGARPLARPSPASARSAARPSRRCCPSPPASAWRRR